MYAYVLLPLFIWFVFPFAIMYPILTIRFICLFVAVFSSSSLRPPCRRLLFRRRRRRRRRRFNILLLLPLWPKVNAIVNDVLEETDHGCRIEQFLVHECGWRGDRFAAEEDYAELQHRARTYVAALEQTAAVIAGDVATAAAEADEHAFFAEHSSTTSALESPRRHAGAAGAAAAVPASPGERRDAVRPLRPIQRLTSMVAAASQDVPSSASASTASTASLRTSVGSLFSTLTSPVSMLGSLSSGGATSPIPFSGGYDSDAEADGILSHRPGSPDALAARIVASASAAIRNVGADGGDGEADAATSPGTAAGVSTAAATPNTKEKGESFLNRMWQQAATAATDWWLCSPGSARGDAPSAASLPKDFEISFEDIIELDMIGSGALGVVFSGVLEGEKVAIKKFRDAKHVGEEARDLKSLSHPNIVALRGICSQEPVYCLVMELCLHSVHDVIKGTKIGPELVCNWAKQVACGMEYLHGQNVVHRDLKTPNVLIAQDERTLKISDFGTSRQTESKSKATAMTFCGSVAWMAPEMVRAEPCSQMVDVWSFGVVLWELLTGQQPYSGVDTAAILYRIGTGAHHLPVASTTPLAFSLLLKQCWNKEPKHRPKFRQILLHLQIVEEDSGFLETPNEVFFADQQDWKRENDDKFSKMKIKMEAKDDSGPSEDDILRKQRERELKHAEDIRRLYEERLLNASQLLVDLRTKMKEVNSDAKKVRRSKSGAGAGTVKYIVGGSSGSKGRRRRKSYSKAEGGGGSVSTLSHFGGRSGSVTGGGAAGNSSGCSTPRENVPPPPGSKTGKLQRSAERLLKAKLIAVLTADGTDPQAGGGGAAGEGADEGRSAASASEKGASASSASTVKAGQKTGKPFAPPAGAAI